MVAIGVDEDGRVQTGHIVIAVHAAGGRVGFEHDPGVEIVDHQSGACRLEDVEVVLMRVVPVRLNTGQVGICLPRIFAGKRGLAWFVRRRCLVHPADHQFRPRG